MLAASTSAISISPSTLRILNTAKRASGGSDFLKYTLPLARQSLEEFKDKEEAKPAKAKAKKTKGGASAEG